MTDLPFEAPSVPSSKPLSPLAARLLKRARAELEVGDSHAAMRTLASVLALAPDDAEALRWTGIAAQGAGDYAQAAASYRRALAILPDDADVHMGLGIALHRLRRVDEGLAHLRRACDLAPDSPSAWYNLAEALQPAAQTAAAIEALERVLALDPAHTPARLSLARAQTSVGRIDVAAAALRDVLGREPDRVGAWLALANLKTLALDATDVRRLRDCVANPRVPENDRIQLEFVLARALEDQGDYDAAWDALQHANAGWRRRVKWDGAGEHRRVEAVFKAFSEPVASAGDPDLGLEVIFIASLPRSGSTLVEQILASHPLVEGANEIRPLIDVVDGETQRSGSAFPLWVPAASAADWQRLGRQYLECTASRRSARPWMTDKNLLNWLLAGTVASMLPAARIVVVRRDPVETCLGCYRQWFDSTSGFSYDLDEMATVCIDFWRLTRFWLRQFPERVFDLEYEALVAQPKATIRRLLDFCGLAFDPACLEFHKTPRAVLSAPSAAQVRQPIRRNTARASRYGNKLDHLRERLREAGLPVAAV